MHIATISAADDDCSNATFSNSPTLFTASTSAASSPTMASDQFNYMRKMSQPLALSMSSLYHHQLPPPSSSSSSLMSSSAGINNLHERKTSVPDHFQYYPSPITSHHHSPLLPAFNSGNHNVARSKSVFQHHRHRSDTGVPTRSASPLQFNTTTAAIFAPPEQAYFPLIPPDNGITTDGSDDTAALKEVSDFANALAALAEEM